jgi:hypothetical protein
MAEKADPYAQFDNDPYAAFDTPPGTLEDTAKTVLPSALRGTLSLLTTPGSISDLVGKGARYALDKVAPESSANKAVKALMAIDTDENGKSISDQHSFFPTYETAKGKIEAKTGPLYEAQTPVGKAVQTGIEVAPSLATGGGGIPGVVAKSVGAGTLGELAQEGAAASKHVLPEAAQPFAEPVAKTLGILAGSASPAGMRRAVTPLPLNGEQAATVAALRQSNPELVEASTAGQLSGSPRLMATEGRVLPNQTANQEEAFTRGAMRTMGVDGMATPANMQHGRMIGDEIGNIRRTNEINPAQFPGLNREINNIVRRHRGTVGPEDAQAITDLQTSIRNGAAGTPNVASMTGRRYDYMRQRIQDRIDNAPTGTESRALSDVRSAMDDAFHRSIPADASQRLRQLETQYANYNALANRTTTGSPVLSPDEVRKAAAKHFGNVNVNTGGNQLSTLADDASRVMTPLPPRTEDVGDAAKVLGLITGAITHGGAGYAAGGPMGALAGSGEGSLVGLFGAPHAMNLGKDMAGRIAASAPAQRYLKNQRWMPGQASSADAAMVARLLASPEFGRVTDQSQ